MKNILITGGCGFIGSHLVRDWVTRYSDRYRIVNLDKLTYAGNPANLADIADSPNYEFRHGDIVDPTLVHELFEEFRFEGVIHLAAESHVDRSIVNPLDFILTNVVGTANLLHCAYTAWKGQLGGKRFYHISTDEVYGSLGPEGVFTEETPFAPRSPYAASKAGSDHLALAYFHTYGMPVVLSNCSNNYGPNQNAEKLIPTVISRLHQRAPIPVYGNGSNVRDWLSVHDHVHAMDLVFHKGEPGQSYAVGGGDEYPNLELVHKLCDLYDQQIGASQGNSRQLVEFVTDRAGHDFRYAIDPSKIQQQLGWQPRVSFEDGLRACLLWYLNNPGWLRPAL